MQDDDLQGMKFLVVDDNPINVEIAQTLLRFKNAKVSTASNGVETLEVLEASQPGTYSAVLLDLRMPLLDGYETVAKMRRHSRADISGLPVIAMSADEVFVDGTKVDDSGFDAFMVKPVNAEKLIEILKGLGR